MHRLAEVPVAQLEMTILIILWILASVACVASGWILSGLHQLNTLGYAVFFAAVCLGFGLWARRRGLPGWRWPRRGWTCRWRRRFGRMLPRIYALAAIFVILGGTLYAPRNYDALTYRIPRILHWWSAAAWHWIQTPNDRMNFSGAGFEWLMMPLFAISHSDRLFYLINVTAFLLMPGLVYGVFAGLGVPRRAAWYWMWLLPMGLCYVMQAGSIGNDSFAVTYMLAAIWFGLRAVRTGRVSDLWMAILAGALLTGVKGSNLPLPLAVGWAILPALKLVRRRPVGSLLVLLLALLVSYAPTAWLNECFTGHWTGDPANAQNYQVRQPLAGIVGNTLQLLAQSLEPPFLPMANPAQAWVGEHLPRALRAFLAQGVPHFNLGFGELPQEEASGLGLGVTLVAVLSLLGALAAWRSKPRSAWPAAARRGLTIGLLAWLSLLAYMIKLGSEATGRLLAAYYPLLLLPFLVHPSQDAWVRPRWRQLLAAGVGVMALVVLILTPARPLWPTRPVLRWLSGLLPGNVIIARAQRVYDVYGHRNDAFASLRAQIPNSVSTIGVIDDMDDMECSLWRPFGERTVVDLGALQMNALPDLEWVVVKDDLVTNQYQSFEQWMGKTGGTIISSQMITAKVHIGPERWSLLRFPGAARRAGRKFGKRDPLPAKPGQTHAPLLQEKKRGRVAPLPGTGDDEEILADRRGAYSGFHEIFHWKNQPVKHSHRGWLEIPAPQEPAADQPGKIAGDIEVAELLNPEPRAGQFGNRLGARVAAVVSEVPVNRRIQLRPGRHEKRQDAQLPLQQRVV